METSIVVKKMTDQSTHVRKIKHVLQDAGSAPVEIGAVYLIRFSKSENFLCEIVKIGSLIECTNLISSLTPLLLSSSSKRAIDSIHDNEIAGSANKKPNSPALVRKANTSSLSKTVLEAVSTRGAADIQSMINPILQGLASSTSTNARSSSEPTGS
jgi:hypothetical protein